MCRLSERHGRRMGGQGAVAFAHHAQDENRELAIKFFFAQEAFVRERNLAQVKVRMRHFPHTQTGAARHGMFSSWLAC
jgi:hypothetical protein